jgi:hypothetical protein
MRCTSLNLLLCSLLLTSCGGSDQLFVSGPTQEEQYQALLTQAGQSMTEAQALAAREPCNTSSQCSSLVLQSQVTPCPFRTVIDYSLISPTAEAASAAASRYNTLQMQAKAIAPPHNTSGSCFENVDLTPLNCVSNKCVRQFIFTPG